MPPMASRGQSSTHARTALQDVLPILRRQLVWIVLCCALVGGAAYFFSVRQDKQYSAKASLLLRDVGASSPTPIDSQGQSSLDPGREAATGARVFSLPVVSRLTSLRLHSKIDGKISTSVSPDSNVASVTASDRDPAFAARIANTFAREFIALRRATAQRAIRSQQVLAQRRYASLDQLERGTRQGRALNRRIQDLRTAAALQTGNATIVERAQKSSSPDSPKPLRNAALGAAIGLLLGIIVAFVREGFDRRVRNAEDVEAQFDCPTLAVVPHARALRRTASSDVALPAGVGEAFRMLRANLRYFHAGDEVRSVLITSATRGEGKSTVAWNLSAAAAQAGERVMLIEVDLRRGTFAEDRKLPPVAGLGDYLSGQASLEEVVLSVPAVAVETGDTSGHVLDVIFAGKGRAGAYDQLGSRRMLDLVVDAHAGYDLVVVDSPPLPVVSDAIPLVSKVSGVIVVARVGTGNRDAVTHLRGHLESLEARLLGVVVNDMPKTLGSYGYGYGYSSYSTPAGSGERPDPGAAPVAPAARAQATGSLSRRAS